MRTVDRSVVLEAPADLVWAATRTPHAFVHVTGAMLRMPAAERIDRPLQVGDVMDGWILLGRIVPFSKHRIEIVGIDHETRTMTTDERGGAIRRWRHEISVTPVDERTCRYRDVIEIDAGPLTALVAAYAQVFYRYRQHRWRRLARLLAVAQRARSAGAA